MLALSLAAINQSRNLVQCCANWPFNIASLKGLYANVIWPLQRYFCVITIYSLFSGENWSFSRISTFSRSFSTFLSTFHPSLFHYSICNSLKSVKRQFYSISIKLLSALYPKNDYPMKILRIGKNILMWSKRYYFKVIPYFYQLLS